MWGADREDQNNVYGGWQGRQNSIFGCCPHQV
ncbi:MAG: hypothetical protein JWQ21_790 [Herminiimonas sp.]|nr:hypothetical protein [Herminiimonas sp.]